MTNGIVEQLRSLGHRVHDEALAQAASRAEDVIPDTRAEVQCTLEKRAGAKGPAAVVLDGPPQDEKALQEAKSKAFDLSKIRQYMGADVLSLLSVPVFIMEPTSMLQKMAEMMEYAGLLDAAAAAQDPVERIALVAAFLMTPFGACERAWKPFNPLLGETYELEGLGPNKDARFFAEQVSHHPPVGAAHAEAARWTYDIVSAPKTRFLGNTLEVFPAGRTRIRLLRPPAPAPTSPSSRPAPAPGGADERAPGSDGAVAAAETYTHLPPHVKVHNVVLGRTWIDAEGDFLVHCPETGLKVVLTFTPCGWFNAGRYQYSGFVTDAAGARRLHLSGQWCSHMDASEVGQGGAPPPPGAARRRLWTCAPKPTGDYYGMTHFARQLNSCGALRAPPLPSDSRRRPDREALAARRLARAGAEKVRLEEMQRAERAQRERAASASAAGAAWSPRWFERDDGLRLLPDEMDVDSVPAWRWREGGFTRLDARLTAAAAAEQRGEDVRGRAEAGLGARPGGVEDSEVCGQGFAPWQFPHLHG